jgi:hypothetical protein
MKRLHGHKRTQPAWRLTCQLKESHFAANGKSAPAHERRFFVQGKMGSPLTGKHRPELIPVNLISRIVLCEQVYGPLYLYKNDPILAKPIFFDGDLTHFSIRLQLTAFFTSAAILASSAAVSPVSA